MVNARGRAGLWAIILFLIFFIAYLLYGWISLPRPERDSKKEIQVIASFYPLAEFARQVGKELIEVQSIVPAGVESHDYEPTAMDIAKIESAKLFLFNGRGIDPWAERASSDLERHGVTVVNMSTAIQGYLESESKGAGKGESNRQSDFGWDPHYWLDPVIAKEETKVIADILCRMDPGHAATYEENTRAYSNKLSELDRKYQNGLRDCRQRTVITSHAAFRYLAARYRLRAISIAGVSPDQEPSPRQLAEISRFVKEDGVEYIFFETLASPKYAQTIAKETGAKTLVLNPIEGLTEEDVKQGKDYLSIMDENLSALRLALRCR